MSRPSVGPSGAVAREREPAAGRVHDEATAFERERPGVDVGESHGRSAGRAVLAATAPQDGGHPGGQLMRVVGLGQVVVRAHSKPGDALDVAPLGRGDEDRRVALLADRPEDGLAGEAGQHQVEDDQIDRFRFERRESRRPVADGRHLMPVALQVEPKELGQTRLVLDDQDPGARDHRPHRSRTHVKES